MLSLAVTRFLTQFTRIQSSHCPLSNPIPKVMTDLVDFGQLKLLIGTQVHHILITHMLIWSDRVLMIIHNLIPHFLLY